MHAVSVYVLDDITPLREQIEDEPQLAICLGDTAEYVCQELKLIDTEFITDQ
jgi:hypothetical protein